MHHESMLRNLIVFQVDSSKLTQRDDQIRTRPRFYGFGGNSSSGYIRVNLSDPTFLGRLRVDPCIMQPEVTYLDL